MALRGVPILKSWPVEGGYTHALRAIVELADGRTGFLKRPTDAMTAAWLRTEVGVYNALSGVPWIPTLLDGDDGADPFLFLEDLRHGTWVPPWTPSRVRAVRALMQKVHAHPPPDFVEEIDLNAVGGWSAVAIDPAAFLALGFADDAWLQHVLPRLLEAEKAIPTGPLGLCHFDLRSDNLVFDGDQLKLFDWNHIKVGPKGLDEAFWSLSLHAEGGPEPSAPCDEAVWAARVSGFFASRAGLPEIPHAPRVRWIQKVQLEVGLGWVRRVFA